MRIAIIGGGQMGTALLTGMLRAEIATPDAVTVCDVDELALKRHREELGVGTTTDMAQAASGADTVIVALKPQVMARALCGLAGRLTSAQTVVSIAAGVTTARLESLLSAQSGDAVHVVRAMPNTPALIGEGMSAICPGAHAESRDMERAESALSSVGRVVRVEEWQMDAVTGLSGSGPGYVYTIIEALADGGCKMGLPKQLALELAAQTVAGAALMVQQTGEHPAVLRDRVTSPGGTTIAGLHAAEALGLRDALISAVEASAHRARELGE